MIALKKNKKLRINNPNSIRDHLYVNDFCRILILLLKNHKIVQNQILNISNENWISNINLINIFKKIIFKNKNLFTFIHSSNEKMINLSNSGKKFKKLFTNFKFTSFEKGVLSTSKFYKII